ncbi:uncharacterized protein LOC129619378 [Condylostylus longicornis]|uniref:uncharacterized protein LOC129619378 n=1 Tax=Condylostylus longicornis TaxID=2530218 RepID=UPI00244DFF1D|nr:uncharacterized protein LOC129619378 [Condylostylus longicornis]
MKSFILHLFVLFLIQIQQNVYSSSLATTSSTINSILSPTSSYFNKTTTTTFHTSSSLLAQKNVLEKEKGKFQLEKLKRPSKTVTSTTESAVASKQLQKEDENNFKIKKSRTARDLQIKNIDLSQSKDSNNFNGNNGNSEVSCITLLKDENIKKDCREQKQQQQQQQQQRRHIQKQKQQHQQQHLSKEEEQIKSLNQASQSLWHETQQSNRVRRTSKTPRTIQRLIAGHLTLSNDPAYSTKKLESETTVTRIKTYSTTPKIEVSTELHSHTTTPASINSTTLSIRKPYRSRTYGSILREKSPNILSAVTSKSSIKGEDYDTNKKDDDEAFLEDTKELDNWDNGILRLGAGDGKEEQTKPKKKLDPNKTLSEQVKDGKYGLIEEEIFKKHPKRPGILSYLQNKEFPHDNEKTLGGLNEEDIWLAEDHLLVIKGGGLNDKDKNEPWAPIDDYIEPDRPIKIPENPKIPPPFPIQLGENEPIQFVGDNQITFGNTPFFNESTAETVPVYPAGIEDKNQIENESNDKKDLPSRKGSYQGTTKLASITDAKNVKEGYFYPSGNPAWNIKNGTIYNPFLNFKPFDFPAVPPNGSVDDILDQFDEDDPSLYYPPPYSFVYKSNYTNPVPAGPLVPGIVLPPPPNAFSRLNAEKRTRKPRPNQPSFRQKLTRLQQYKPKTIVVTPDPITSTTPTAKYSSPTRTTTSSSTTTSQPPVEFDMNKQVVYAITEVPPPYGKVRYYTPSSNIYSTSTTQKPSTEPAPVEEVISFVPKAKSKAPKNDGLSLKNPIYYEYYDLKPTPLPTPEVYYKEILPPTLPPNPTIPLRHTTSPMPQAISQTPTPVPITSVSPEPKQPTKKHKVSKITTIKPVLRKPHKHYSSQGKTYLTPRPYNFDEFANIKPHPEIRPNGIAYYENSAEPIKPFYNREPKPAVPDFDREINAIRQTLQLFNGNPQSQQQQQVYDYNQSTHKPRPIYEYSFDARRPNPTTSKPQFDSEPFQPMVKYSPPVDEVNGFRAITYPEINDPSYYNVVTNAPPESDVSQNNDIHVQVIYDSTPRPENGFYSNSPLQATHSTLGQPQNPWISIEKQVVQEIGNNGLPITSRRPPKRRPNSRKIEQVPKNNKFEGYFYGPPQASASQIQRTNNRYYEEPFTKHLSEIRKKLSATQPEHQTHWMIFENTTNSNYVSPRPLTNSNSEQFEQYLRERTFEDPSLVRSSSWNSANDTIPITQQYKKGVAENLQLQSEWVNPQPIKQQQQLQQPAQVWNLESDINVNNIAYGRPPINPDAEFIEQYRQPSHHKPHREKYRDSSKSIKPNSEPFKQYLREVTPTENQASQSQKLWGLESHVSESYPRPTINQHSEVMEQSSRPSHHYRQQQQLQHSQQLQIINGAESFKQYLRKVAPNKNYNPSNPPQVWRLDNDTNVNRIPYGRPPVNPNSEFIAPPPLPPHPSQKRPIYRENIRDLIPPFKFQQSQQQQFHQQQQQQSCKWPHNCNTYSSSQQQQPQHGIVSPGHSLHSDLNINYGQKLPPLNPNSEFINPYQPFLQHQQEQQQNQQQQQQLELKPIYNRPQSLLDSNYYQQSPYQNINNQRPQRPPK